jgi:hypothetical protein
MRSQRFNGDLGFEELREWGTVWIAVLNGSWNLQDMELNVLSNGLVLELNEKYVVVETTVLKLISGIVIVWDELNTSQLLHVKVKESIVVFTRLKVNVVIGSSVEVLVGLFDRQGSKTSLSARMPKVVVRPDSIRIKTNVHFNLA